MSPTLIESVVEAVARRTGVPARGLLVSPDVLQLEPAQEPRTGGFAVHVRTGWRSAEASFVPGRFALPFVRHLGRAAPESQIAFYALAREQASVGRITARVNGLALDLTTDKWPADWSAFELSMRRERIVPEELQPREMRELLAGLAVPMFGMIVALAGTDDVEADASALEGAPSEEWSRRYERKPINREICLALKGHRCWCCRLDFAERYGPEARGVIEVHHRVPVSGVRAGYLVHPVRDLFPVCSNCHTVLHLTEPPGDPDELRLRLAEKSEAAS
jgi:5-methylcytosine-specific restriction protein A